MGLRCHHRRGQSPLHLVQLLLLASSLGTTGARGPIGGAGGEEGEEGGGQGSSLGTGPVQVLDYTVWLGPGHAPTLDI